MIIVKGLILCLSLFAVAANAQVLTADFSMLETGPGLNSLVKGNIRYQASPQALRWDITHPAPKVLNVPEKPGKPTDEESATLRLFGYYLQKNSYSETSIAGRKDWRRAAVEKGVVEYAQIKKDALNTRLRYSENKLLSTSFELGPGHEAAYLYSNYKDLPGLGVVPTHITTVFTETGKKSYKRLVLKNLMLKP